MDLENLRRSYEESSLKSEDLAECPFQQFESWFKHAQSAPAPAWFEVNAMTLATASPDRVSSRIVLLKQFGPDGFVFFTNYMSEKGRQLAANPLASLVLYWPHVERQVRVEGEVAKTSAEVSDTYFHARPPSSQLGAVASPQSSKISSREELIESTMELAKQYGDEEVPRPEHWGGYVLKPARIEFWQGRPSRLHDRFVYERQAGHEPWNLERLAP